MNYESDTISNTETLHQRLSSFQIIRIWIFSRSGLKVLFAPVKFQFLGVWPPKFSSTSFGPTYKPWSRTYMANKLLHNWLDRGYNWLGRGHVWLYRGHKWLDRGHVWIGRGHKWLDRGHKWLHLLIFDNNFSKYEPIFKILSPNDSYENALFIYHKDFHLACSMLLHYLVKFENWKCYRIFTLNVTTNMFN